MRENQRGANGFLDNPRLEGVWFMLIFNAEVLHAFYFISKTRLKFANFQIFSDNIEN